MVCRNWSIVTFHVTKQKELLVMNLSSDTFYSLFLFLRNMQLVYLITNIILLCAILLLYNLFKPCRMNAIKVKFQNWIFSVMLWFIISSIFLFDYYIYYLLPVILYS